MYLSVRINGKQLSLSELPSPTCLMTEVLSPLLYHGNYVDGPRTPDYVDEGLSAIRTKDGLLEQKCLSEIRTN
jgi:hypothetical protein